jgi:hypothetical protein
MLQFVRVKIKASHTHPRCHLACGSRLVFALLRTAGYSMSLAAEGMLEFGKLKKGASLIHHVSRLFVSLISRFEHSRCLFLMFAQAGPEQSLCYQGAAILPGMVAGFRLHGGMGVLICIHACRTCMA